MAEYKHLHPWLQTYSGVKFNPRQPHVSDVRIEDIAHSLANVCRFGGHVIHFYSVAQHSVLISYAVPRPWALQGLLHDSPEAYLGDVVKPLKVLLKDYKEMENGIWRKVAKKFHVPVKMHPSVGIEDARALATERRDLLDQGPRWSMLNGIKPWKEEIVPWAPSVAKAMFLRRFEELYHPR